MKTPTVCSFCDARPQYYDRHSGQYVCLKHARLEVVAAGPRPPLPPLTIRPATSADLPQIQELSLYFWDETDVDCFERQYDVLTCPAFLACEGDQAVGVASYTVEEEWDSVVLVILNVLAGWQGRGGGQALLDALRNQTAQLGLGRILVVTTNHDLPALALYQRYGFHITGIVPGREVEYHGVELPGFAGIPVRDEIRLEYQL
jgi:GNAT superfamily N-acetyltransferase